MISEDVCPIDFFEEREGCPHSDRVQVISPLENNI